ncbi:MAG: hypothetical protein MUE41_18590, partial [Gemmatimonadaceae bacterium]|nr:hypothetical protein [Gemmatimonadaceae bacterium]
MRDAILRAGSFTCQALGFLGVMGGTLLASLGVAGDDFFPRDDLKPGSGFLDTLAQTPEHYLRVGITHRVPKRWSFARLAGENVEAAATWNDPSAANAASLVSQVHRVALFQMINAMVSIWALDAITSNQFSMG